MTLSLILRIYREHPRLLKWTKWRKQTARYGERSIPSAVVAVPSIKARTSSLAGRHLQPTSSGKTRKIR